MVRLHAIHNAIGSLAQGRFKGMKCLGRRDSNPGHSNLQKTDVAPEVVLAAVGPLSERQELFPDHLHLLRQRTHLLVLRVDLGVEVAQLAGVFAELQQVTTFLVLTSCVQGRDGIGSANRFVQPDQPANEPICGLYI